MSQNPADPEGSGSEGWGCAEQQDELRAACPAALGGAGIRTLLSTSCQPWGCKPPGAEPWLPQEPGNEFSSPDTALGTSLSC